MFCCCEAHSCISDRINTLVYKIQNTITMMKIQEYFGPPESEFIDTHEGYVLRGGEMIKHKFAQFINL